MLGSGPAGEPASVPASEPGSAQTLMEPHRETSSTAPCLATQGQRVTFLVNVWLGHRPSRIESLPQSLAASLSQRYARPSAEGDETTWRARPSPRLTTLPLLVMHHSDRGVGPTACLACSPRHLRHSLHSRSHCAVTCERFSHTTSPRQRWRTRSDQSPRPRCAQCGCVVLLAQDLAGRDRTRRIGVAMRHQGAPCPRACTLRAFAHDGCPVLVKPTRLCTPAPALPTLGPGDFAVLWPTTQAAPSAAGAATTEREGGRCREHAEPRIRT